MGASVGVGADADADVLLETVMSFPLRVDGGDLRGAGQVGRSPLA